MAIPSLGYPSMTAAAVALSDEGASDREIADKLEIEPHRVQALIRQATERAKRAAEGKVPNYLAVFLPERAVLLPAAEARNISISELVRRIVLATAQDGFIDAVLDDGVLTLPDEVR